MSFNFWEQLANRQLAIANPVGLPPLFVVRRHDGALDCFCGGSCYFVDRDRWQSPIGRAIHSVQYGSGSDRIQVSRLFKCMSAIVTIGSEG